MFSHPTVGTVMLEADPFMGGMLVDQHETVIVLEKKIGVLQLADKVKPREAGNGGNAIGAWGLGIRS